MELPHTVKVLEECQIAPPSGSVPHTTLPLTFFDLVYLTMPPVHRLFFYNYHYPKAHFIDTVLPNIKKSLSLTLQHFYPFAGNLKWPQESAKPELVYEEDDAVPLTVVESDYEFYQLSGNHVRDATVFPPLIPKLRYTTSNEKLVPLLALQVTLFPGKGICIGITINHVVSDGRTSIHFIKSWASVCRLEGDTSLMTASLPYYDRSIISYLDPKAMDYLNIFEKYNVVTKDTFHTLKVDHLPPIDRVRATFVMGLNDIKRLKKWVSARLEMEAPFNLSSLVVTCAYVWVCLLKARWGETDHENEAEEHIIVPIDARARLDPPLPVTYFGNCIGGIDVMCNRSVLIGEDGIAVAANLIGKAIKNYDFYAQLDRDLSYFMSIPKGQIEGVGSSPRFAVYDTDFGWGKPEKVEMNPIDGGQSIALSECPNEAGAIEIGLVRKKAEMDPFAYSFANSIELLS
ncbi:hypothetical protein AQUCO_04200110v1 [Aquilegia coerulea]|uniref:Uncharacterized protein n=1 Tax=Aquilegia coerulea TaxID=218851 RepID=A0A2G5CPA5_AQUCA|nr:hypothetical protein AQUCO_04200110v1 [Aquilegia coerulea]